MILCLDAKTWLLNLRGLWGNFFLSYFWLSNVTMKHFPNNKAFKLNNIWFSFHLWRRGRRKRWRKRRGRMRKKENSCTSYRQNLKHRGNEKLLGVYDKYQNLNWMQDACLILLPPESQNWFHVFCKRSSLHSCTYHMFYQSFSCSFSLFHTHTHTHTEYFIYFNYFKLLLHT